MSKTKIFFASDLHGSERCWRKFLNAGKHFKANVIIMGGDITGKLRADRRAAGRRLQLQVPERKTVHAGAELEESRAPSRTWGTTRCACSPEELNALCDPKVRSGPLPRGDARGSMRWLDIAEEKLKGTGCRFVSPGNDDIWEVDAILKEQSIVEVPDGCRIQIDDEHEMIGVGWSTTTPWHTERECTEDAYTNKIERLVGQVTNMEKAIFDFHCPPFGSGLRQRAGTQRRPQGKKDPWSTGHDSGRQSRGSRRDPAISAAPRPPWTYPRVQGSGTPGPDALCEPWE